MITPWERRRLAGERITTREPAGETPALPGMGMFEFRRPSAMIAAKQWPP